HLDHHASAVGKASSMDLADRGGGDRVSLEVGEEFTGGFAQVFLDGGQNHLRRIGRGLGLQLGQLLSKIGSDEIGTCAENLAEFDEGGAQLGQSSAYPAFAR